MKGYGIEKVLRDKVMLLGIVAFWCMVKERQKKVNIQYTMCNGERS